MSLGDELNVAVLAAILPFVVMASLVDFEVSVFRELLLAYVALEWLDPLVLSDMYFKPTLLGITLPTLFAFERLLLAVIELVSLQVALCNEGHVTPFKVTSEWSFSGLY